MATNTKPDPRLQTDVDTIRSILFGDQAQEFQQRITLLEKLVTELQEENKKLTTALKEETKTREANDARGGEGLDSVHAALTTHLTQLGEELKAQTKADRENAQQSLKSLQENFSERLNSQIKNLSEALNEQAEAQKQGLENYQTQSANQLQEARNEFKTLVQMHQLKQDTLIDALAKALLAYQGDA